MAKCGSGKMPMAGMPKSPDAMKKMQKPKTGKRGPGVKKPPVPKVK